MCLNGDLFMPLGPGRTCLVTTQASAVIAFIDLDFRVVAVGLAGAMATLAGQGFVLEFSQFLHLIRMTFFAGFFPGKAGFPGAEFGKCCRPVPTVLAKGGWG